MQNAGEPWLEMRNNIHIILTIIITMTHIQGFSTGDFMEIRWHLTQINYCWKVNILLAQKATR